MKFVKNIFKTKIEKCKKMVFDYNKKNSLRYTIIWLNYNNFT